MPKKQGHRGDDEHIHHVGAKNIAQGNAGACSTQTDETIDGEFRQRGGDGDQHGANPELSQPVLLGEFIAKFGQVYPGNDHANGAGDKDGDGTA